MNGNLIPAFKIISKQSCLVRPASASGAIITGSLSVLAELKLSMRHCSSWVRPRTRKSHLLNLSHINLACRFKTSVQGAPFGLDINCLCSPPSTALDDGNIGCITSSQVTPSHFSTSFKNLRLSASSSAMGLLQILISCVLPYFSIVSFAATALAAPQENQTAITGLLIHPPAQGQ